MLWLAPWLLWLFPNFPFNKSINPGNLTSDPEMAQTYAEDPLHNGHVCLKTVLEPMLAGYHILEKDYVNWPPSVKLLITHGDNDPSTSSQASRDYIERVPADDKEFKSWPGMLHEGHNERPELREPFLDFSIR